MLRLCVCEGFRRIAECDIRLTLFAPPSSGDGSSCQSLVTIELIRGDVIVPGNQWHPRLAAAELAPSKQPTSTQPLLDFNQTLTALLSALAPALFPNSYEIAVNTPFTSHYDWRAAGSTDADAIKLRPSNGSVQAVPPTHARFAAFELFHDRLPVLFTVRLLHAAKLRTGTACFFAQ